MMRVLFIALLSLVTVSFVQAQTTLNGIAPYEKLSKEYYIGALYLAEPQQDPALILSDNREQKMVLKVTTNRWSQRKFAESWRQDLTLNNDMSVNPALTGQILEFTRFPKQTLTTGDELLFQYSPKFGSEVYLNQELVFQYQGKEFFNALLRAWIGDVPHSRLFQQEILALTDDAKKNDDTLLDRIRSTVIQKPRLKLVSNWKSEEQAAKQALAKAEQEAKARAKREEEARKKAATEKERLEKERQQALALAEQRRKDAEAAAAQDDSESVEKALAEQKAAEEKAKALAVEQAKEAELSAQKQKQSKAVQFAYEQYRWEVLRDVYKRVSYPEWARQFKEEGVVSIEFIISRQGQLLGISNVQPSNDGFLGQELKDAVNRAAPFKPFPVQIKDSQLRVTVDYEFTLDERVADIPPAPVAPEGVGSTDELTSVQKAVAWSQYKDQVVNELDSAIEYPFWAQDLKQEGTVTAEVTVRSDGSIAKVKIKKRSRHNILNQEVEQAMERVGSLTAFPAWITDDSLTVLIEHTFKL